jgi:hypothetical protein
MATREVAGNLRVRVVEAEAEVATLTSEVTRLTKELRVKTRQHATSEAASRSNFAMLKTEMDAQEARIETIVGERCAAKEEDFRQQLRDMEERYKREAREASEAAAKRDSFERNKLQQALELENTKRMAAEVERITCVVCHVL